MKRTTILFRTVAAALAVLTMLGALGCTLISEAYKTYVWDNETRFIKLFELDTRKQNLSFECISDDHGGWMGEGLGVYKISVNEEAKDAFLEWDSLPLSKEAQEFVRSCQSLVMIPLTAELAENAQKYEYSLALPMMERARWRFIDRDPDHKSGSTSGNCSFCVFDEDTNTAYLVILDT